MSFASNKTVHTIPRVSRGRVIVGGGFKNGGFSMYGSQPKAKKQYTVAPRWAQPVLDEKYKKIENANKIDKKYKKMAEDLELRRDVRRKSGKYEDTEGMRIKQEKIDRYYREKKKADDEKFARSIGLFIFLLIGIGLLFTPLWWVGVIFILTRLTTD